MSLDAPALLVTPHLPGTGGRLRTIEEDFRVEEIAAYAPADRGDHVLAVVEKRGLTSMDAIAALARALGVASGDIGCAGLKDRHAVTVQQLSFPPPLTPEAVLAVRVPQVRVLSAARHPHKLKTGHLHGNRFTVTVRELAVSAEQAARRAEAVLAELARPPGSPNWFGAQRFGRNGANAAAGRALIRGEDHGGRPPRGRKRRLLISAYQSHLFNDYLRRRIDDGAFRSALAGDVMQTRSGGLFGCEDVAADQPRLARGEIIPTGPIFGHKMRQPAAGSDAAAREGAVLAAAELSLDSFRPAGKLALGTRRAIAVRLADAGARPTDEGAIEITFQLPPGAYATAVLSEIMKSESNAAE